MNAGERAAQAGGRERAVRAHVELNRGDGNLPENAGVGPGAEATNRPIGLAPRSECLQTHSTAGTKPLHAGIAEDDVTALAIWKRPSAFLPVAMSVGALATVVVYLALHGPAPQADEGAAAHIWQLLMAAQIPFVLFFAVKWLPQSPRRAAALRWPWPRCGRCCVSRTASSRR